MNNKFRNIIEELEWRGSLKDYTPGANEILIKAKITCSNGFDPTEIKFRQFSQTICFPPDLGSALQ